MHQQNRNKRTDQEPVTSVARMRSQSLVLIVLTAIARCEGDVSGRSSHSAKDTGTDRSIPEINMPVAELLIEVGFPVRLAVFSKLVG